MGRKLEFSKDKALMQAMESFWAQGYDATSMRDLAQRLNLHLGSVYNALGDKEEVFEQSLRLYLKHQVAPRLATLESSSDPTTALKTFIDSIAADCRADSTSPGCFIINSLLCITRINDKITEIVREYMRMQEAALAACIARAQAEGKINSNENPEQLARFVIGSYKAMHVMRKIGANDDYVSDIRATVDTRLFNKNSA